MNTLALILSGIAGATLTYFVSTHFKQSTVRASALLSLLVGLFFYAFPDLLSTFLTKNIPMVFFGSSFIGMVSTKYQVNYIHLAMAGVLFSMIYLLKSDFFIGFGGMLGAIALISLLSTLGVTKLVSKSNSLKKGAQNAKSSLKPLFRGKHNRK